MRSPKAVNRPHCSCYLRSRVQNKKRSFYANRRAVAVWIATTPCTDSKKTLDAKIQPVSVKDKKPKSSKVKKEKKSTEKTSKIVEDKVEIKDVGLSAAEKKAETIAKKEQQKKAKEEREALKKEEEQRKAEELKQKQLEEAEKKKADKQRRREEEEAKAQAAKERKEKEAELRAEQEKQKVVEKEEKKKLAAEKKTKEEEEKKRVAAEKQAKAEEENRKRQEAEEQRAEEEKKRIAEEQAAIELKELEEKERKEREQQALEEAQRQKEISDRQLAEEKAAAERKAKEEEEEKKRISELQAEAELRELEEKQRKEQEAKLEAEQQAKKSQEEEVLQVENGHMAKETVEKAMDIKDHAEEESNQILDDGAADAIHTHEEAVNHAEHKNENKKSKNKKNKKKNGNSVSEEEHVQKKVVQNEGAKAQKHSKHPAHDNHHEDVLKVENGKMADQTVSEALEVKNHAKQEQNKVLDEGAANAIHTHEEAVNHHTQDKSHDNKKSKNNKKNKKKNANSVTEEDHVQKNVTHDDQAQSSSNGTGKDMHQELAVDVNTNTSVHETSHTKCSIDSGVDVTDFSTGKKSKKGKKGQQSVSDASLSSTKSSSNESISELPENGISPKTPTSTPVNESMIEQVVINGTEALPLKEQSPTKFAQQVAEFVTQAQQVIISQKATSQPLKHIKIEPIVPLVLPPKIERNPRRERVYKLLPRDIEYCAYMMETYGEDYDGMTKDKRNIYMDSTSSMRRKIRIFRDSPQYELYLKAKEEGRPIESIC